MPARKTLSFSLADTLKLRCSGCLDQPVWLLRWLLLLPGDSRPMNAEAGGTLSDQEAARRAIARTRHERAQRNGLSGRSYRFSAIFTAWLDASETMTIGAFIEMVASGASAEDRLVHELDEALLFLDSFFRHLTKVRLEHRKLREKPTEFVRFLRA